VPTTWNSEDWFWKRTIVYSAIAVAVVAAGAYYYFSMMKREAQPVAQAPVAPAAPPESPPPEHHPIPGAGADAAATEPLPPVSESDPVLTDALSDFFGKPVEQLLVPNQLVRHFVVTVDNLPRNKVAEQMRPVKPTGGQAVVVTNGDTITLSDDNFARYAPVMKLVQGMDVSQFGALYIHFYPLFQQEYENLGYPGQYFNDRLVQVIDHLLKTPELHGPIELKQGHVFYEYADPTLEARSAGQKLLMRMGSENEAIIKGKLRQLRDVITKSQDPPGSADP
jgi:hypothetical protein